MPSRSEWRQERAALGLCRDCDGIPKFGKVLCDRCRARRAGYARSRLARMKKEGRCPACGDKWKGRTVYCVSCVSTAVKKGRDQRREARIELFKHLGSKCAHCGETDYRVLTVDHVNGDGHKDRSRAGRRGFLHLRLYRRIRYGLPIPKVQLLCFNCHAKKDITPWWLKDGTTQTNSSQ